MAGFFGLFDYSKPGKGVRKDEPQRHRFVQFFILLQRKFWKLCQLNLLFLLFCIPIVTIGPAIAAMTYVLRNMVNEQPLFLFSDFWDAFKANWKQSFVYTLLLTVVIVVFSVAWSFYSASATGNSLLYLPLGFVLLMSLLTVFANFYIYLMIVTLDLPLRAIIKNGFILAILCLKTNFITLFFLAVITIALWILPVIGAIVYIFLGFALIGFLVCYNAFPGIKKYAIDPYMEKLRAEAGEGDAAPEEVDDGQEQVFQDEVLLDKFKDAMGEDTEE